MLAQVSGDTVTLMPALPRAWDEGRVKGLRLKGGMTLNLEWKNGKATAELFTSHPKPVKLAVGKNDGQTIDAQIKEGEGYTFTFTLGEDI
jgi:alpha-L-fucosidase 2